MPLSLPSTLRIKLGKRKIIILICYLFKLVFRNEQCNLEEFKGRVRGGEASHGDQDRWRRWQVGGNFDGDGDGGSDGDLLLQ